MKIPVGQWNKVFWKFLEKDQGVLVKLTGSPGELSSKKKLTLLNMGGIISFLVKLSNASILVER